MQEIRLISWYHKCPPHLQRFSGCCHSKVHSRSWFRDTERMPRKTPYTQLYIQITSWCYANPSVWFAEISGSDFATIESNQFAGWRIWLVKIFCKIKPRWSYKLWLPHYTSTCCHYLIIIKIIHKMTFLYLHMYHAELLHILLQTCLTSPAGTILQGALWRRDGRPWLSRNSVDLIVDLHFSA